MNKNLSLTGLVLALLALVAVGEENPAGDPGNAKK